MTDYTGPNRRNGCPEVTDIHEHLTDGRRRMDALESSLASMQSDVAEVLEILKLGKSFFRVAGYVGSFLKWTTAIAAPLVAMWLAFKGGKS